MKKIYTLLAAAAVAASATAAIQPAKAQHYELRPGAESQLKEFKALAEKHVDVPGMETTTRTMIKDGKTWNIQFTLQKSTGWWDLLSTTDKETGESRPMTQEEYPFYLGYYALYTDDESEFYDYYMQWPCYYSYIQIFDVDIYNQIEAGDLEPNFEPITVDDWALNDWNGMVHCPANFYVSPGSFWTFSYESQDSNNVIGNVMYPSNLLSSSNSWTVNGKSREGYVNQTSGSYDFKNRSALELEGYNESTKEIEVYTNNFYVNGSSVGQVPLVYKGTFTQTGFIAAHYRFDCNEIHIFNAGQPTDKFLSRTMGYQMLPENPVQRFYMGLFNPDVTCGWRSETEVAFDSTLLGFMLTENGNEDTAFAIYGALYSAASSEEIPTIPSEPWNMVPYKEEQDGDYWIISTHPEPQVMIPSGNYFTATMAIVDNSLSPHDGTFVFEGGYIRYLCPETSFQTGTTDGAVFMGHNSLGDDFAMNAPFTGKIIYHYDASDIQKTMEVDAVGTAENTLGVKNVVVANDNLNVFVLGNNIVAPEGAVVYNLNGQRVSGNGVAAGIYVVRVGNKAVKVLVK